MQRLLDLGGEELIVWIAVLAALAAVVYYVVGKIRAKTAQHEPTTTEMISKFSELHSRGELTDAEFRTIKTALAAQLQKELRDNGETG